VVSDTQWAAFCRAFDLEDLASVEEYRTNPGRVAGRESIIPIIKAKIASMTRAEAASRCEAAVLPFAPINRPEDLFDDPQLAVPGAMTPLTLPNGKQLPLPALPVEFDGERPGLRLDLPGIGEHSASVAASLGYSPEQIEQMLEENIISAETAGVLSARG
jgi:crotonobetainyl-CoA:carnitine CoA-transferase CaiB-like acyl-CoA transferase